MPPPPFEAPLAKRTDICPVNYAMGGEDGVIVCVFFFSPPFPQCNVCRQVYGEEDVSSSILCGLQRLTVLYLTVSVCGEHNNAAQLLSNLVIGVLNME